MQEQATSKNTSSKRIAKNVLFLYIRLFLILIVGLYTSRVVLDRLGAVDYGLFNVVGSLVLIFTFVSGSLSSSASRFMSVELEVGNQMSQNRVFCMTLNIHLIIAAIVLVLAETIGVWYLFNKMVIPDDRLFAAFLVYQLSCISAILALLVVPYRALIIANEQMKAFAYLSIFEVLAKLAIAFCLYINGIDKLILYGLMLCFVQVGVNMLYLIYCRKTFRESNYHRLWDGPLFKEMIIFSGWSTCGTLATSAVSQGYNLLLNLFCGPIVNAARGLAYQVQTKIVQFATNFQIALNPQIVKNYASSDIERVEDLVNMSIKISFSLMFILLFPLLVNIEGVLSIWLVDVPNNTSLFVVLICVTAVFGAMSNPFGVVAEAANQLKKVMLITTPIFLLALPISYCALYFKMPAYSVFIIALFAEFIVLWVKFFIARGILSDKMRMTSFLLLKCICSIFLFFCIGFLLRSFFDSKLLSVFICGMICLIFSSLWVLYIILSKHERDVVISKIKVFLSKRR